MFCGDDEMSLDLTLLLADLTLSGRNNVLQRVSTATENDIDPIVVLNLRIQPFSIYSSVYFTT